MPKPKPSTQADPSLSLVKLCARALDSKKAECLQVLDVSAQSSITNYLVLANAGSEPHLRALRVELEKALDAAQARLVGIDSSQGSGWTVVDAFDVMVHLFTEENREKYRLDQLWKDATEVSVAKLLAAPVKRTKKAKSAAKTN